MSTLKKLYRLFFPEYSETFLLIVLAVTLITGALKYYWEHA